MEISVIKHCYIFFSRVTLYQVSAISTPAGTTDLIHDSVSASSRSLATRRRFKGDKSKPVALEVADVVEADGVIGVARIARRADGALNTGTQDTKNTPTPNRTEEQLLYIVY